jgi:hypothetical protein
MMRRRRRTEFWKDDPQKRVERGDEGKGALKKNKTMGRQVSAAHLLLEPAVVFRGGDCIDWDSACRAVGKVRGKAGHVGDNGLSRCNPRGRRGTSRRHHAHGVRSGCLACDNGPVRDGKRCGSAQRQGGWRREGGGHRKEDGSKERRLKLHAQHAAPHLVAVGIGGDLRVPYSFLPLVSNRDAAEERQKQTSPPCVMRVDQLVNTGHTTQVHAKFQPGVRGVLSRFFLKRLRMVGSPRGM